MIKPNLMAFLMISCVIFVPGCLEDDNPPLTLSVNVSHYPSTSTSAEATAIASGGDEDYSYTWSINGMTLTSDNSIQYLDNLNLGQNTISVTVTDGEGVSQSTMQTFVVDAMPLRGSINATSSDTVVIASAEEVTGGVSPYDYTWDLRRADGSEITTEYNSDSFYRSFWRSDSGDYILSLTIFDAAGTRIEDSYSFTIREWDSDWKVEFTFVSTQLDGVYGEYDDVDFRYYFDEQNRGEFEVGQLCETSTRTEGDGIEQSLGKSCTFDVPDEDFTASITTCANINYDSSNEEVVDIYSGNALASDMTGCILVNDYEIKEYRLDMDVLDSENGIDDQDNGDNPWNGILNIKWKLIDDGKYRSFDATTGDDYVSASAEEVTGGVSPYEYSWDLSRADGSVIISSSGGSSSFYRGGLDSGDYILSLEIIDAAGTITEDSYSFSIK